MPWHEVWINLIIDIIAGIFIFLLGLFWPVIPKSIRKYRLKKFFGPSIFSDKFVIVYGTLQDLRPRFDDAGNPILRFHKVFRNGQIINVAGPHENIVGDCEIRASGYLLQSIGKIREQMIEVKSDIEALKDLNFTFISLGSPASNQITGFALREPRNQLLNFIQENQSVFIVSISDKKKYGLENKDRALILRIRNERFPKHYFFVCAGLGEWGTSGASWYLATHWEDLYKEFKGDDFGVVVEIDIGIDTSASRIATIKSPMK
jgi:hypothetical protein